MLIAAISDTHGRHRELEIPDVDLLLFAGDMTRRGELSIVADFNAWLATLKQLKHTPICIAGNHDFCFADRYTSKLLLSNAVYLCDELIEVEKLKIYGSPWTPEFGNWAFMSSRPQMSKHWRSLANGAVKPDILLTHGPPSGILDVTKGGVVTGCESLKRAVQICKPKYHIFGHIHEARGQLTIDNTTFINAASLDENYREVKQPIVIEI